MKRRSFISTGLAGAALAGSGCAGRVKLIRDRTIRKSPEEMLKVTRSKPRGGTMPTTELGTTGIKVSRFAFGSHMSSDLLTYEKERERMIHEAFDLGITVFDVYEKNWNIFQYEPMGRHLAPIRRDIVLSTDMVPFDGRSIEEELERDLRLLRTDYIDMVRYHSRDPKATNWAGWEKMFRFKEQGKIRAVGVAMHLEPDLDQILEQNLPLDYVVFPYNFYHTLIYDGRIGGEYTDLTAKLRARGIGIVVMKPMGSDDFVNSFIDAAVKLDKSGEISLPKAALRHVQNFGPIPDTALNGMYSLDHVYENVEAYYNPAISSEELALLDLIRKRSKVIAQTPVHHRHAFLNNLVPGCAGHGELRTV
jgi:aryl-alcohol dehydrogenase-like predicted oxidoreductase